MQGRGKETDNLYQLLSVKYLDTAVGPGILLAYYEYLLAQARNDEAEIQLAKLQREFPDSPELALAMNEGSGVAIGYAPTPSRLLPKDLPLPQGGSGPVQAPPAAQAPAAEQAPPVQAPSTQPAATAQPSSPTVLVQTGSFRDRENAQYMVRDLEASGFEAEIVEKQIGGNLYYRVVIGPLMTVDQAQAVLMKLKDASFEGVLLFPE
jgi:hypothetical protein